MIHIDADWLEILRQKGEVEALNRLLYDDILRSPVPMFVRHDSPTIANCRLSFGELHMGGEEMQELIVTTNYKLKIKKVIYNDPATIIIWRDGEKTVVKCDKNDTYDPEKGFLLCVLKRLLGNKGNYNKELNKWLFESATREDE